MDNTPRVRSFKEWKADYFHHPIEVKIGWYPYEEEKSIYFGMDIDNELLGRLIKQSLMTQQPITEPLTAFLEDADCSTCHPAEIEIK